MRGIYVASQDAQKETSYAQITQTKILKEKMKWKNDTEG